MSLPLKAEINLSDIANNLSAVKSKLDRAVKVCAVVKSDAYGHGLVEVASCLYSRADYFAVSLASEALALRYAGIDKPILLLTPAFCENYAVLIKRGITLIVSTLSELKEIAKTAKSMHIVASVHIKINTGMNRLGANSVCEINEMLSFALYSDSVSIDGALTHFGDVLNKKYLTRQFENFKKLSDPVKNFNDKAILHASSSGATLLGDRYHFSMVRLGIALYGYKPFETSEISLKPAMKIYARTLLTRKDLFGEKIGYGSTKFYKESATLLRLGYADGFRRTTRGFINDLCMDLSAVSGDVKEEYHLIMQDACELAKYYKTIPYEILTSVTKRADKVYLEN